MYYISICCSCKVHLLEVHAPYTVIHLLLFKRKSSVGSTTKPLLNFQEPSRVIPNSCLQKYCFLSSFKVVFATPFGSILLIFKINPMEKTSFISPSFNPQAHLRISNLQKVDNAIHQLTIDLESVKDIQIGRPVRYYNAYRSYTLNFGIMQLEKLIVISQPHQKVLIKNLLSSYNLLKSSFTNPKIF